MVGINNKPSSLFPDSIPTSIFYSSTEYNTSFVNADIIWMWFLGWIYTFTSPYVYRRLILNSMKNSARPKKSVLFYPRLVIWLNDYKNLVTFVTVYLNLAETWILIQLGNFRVSVIYCRLYCLLVDWYLYYKVNKIIISVYWPI